MSDRGPEDCSGIERLHRLLEMIGWNPAPGQCPRTSDEEMLRAITGYGTLEELDEDEFDGKKSGTYTRPDDKFA